jgi:Rieske Fe-S protein
VTQEPHKDSLATRRGVLAGVGLVGLAGAITACGASGSSSSSSAAAAATTSAPAGGASASSSAASSSAASSSAAASGSASAAASGGSAANALATTSEIKVGSGMIFPAKLVVVTQPTAGDYKAFSAVCTHMGCTVSTISDGTIDCPCHGSKYSVKDGSVVNGPATKPLPAKQIKVTGNSIFLE